MLKTNVVKVKWCLLCENKETKDIKEVEIEAESLQAAIIMLDRTQYKFLRGYRRVEEGK